MIEKLYKRLFTVEDVNNNFGYDLESITVVGGFPSKEAACEAWCDEAALAIHTLVSNKRGINYAKGMYDYALEKNADGELVHKEYHDALAWAQLYQMLFIIENGNISLQAKTDEKIKRYSDDAISILIEQNILIYGF